MFGRNFNRVVPGMRSIPARTINDPAYQVERDARLRLGGSLAWRGGGGNDVATQVRARLYKTMRVLSWTGAGYQWQGVAGGSGGAWTDVAGDTDQGFDYLFEFNGNTAIASGTVVEAEREPYSGEWRVQAAACS